ncbi:hypothetical protein R1sor_004638 [Riccia sorocarpa]|uniref:Uncharacterized protein n=1 Tax=Riccia sorocarpa TaxID=122646 RepID=A0ABD3HKS0_9MARC
MSTPTSFLLAYPPILNRNPRVQKDARSATPTTGINNDKKNPDLAPKKHHIKRNPDPHHIKDPNPLAMVLVIQQESEQYQLHAQLQQLKSLQQEINRRLHSQGNSFSRLAEEAKEATKGCQGNMKASQTPKLTENSQFSQDAADAKIEELVNRLTNQGAAAVLGAQLNTLRKVTDFQVNFESMSSGPNANSAKQDQDPRPKKPL